MIHPGIIDSRRQEVLAPTSDWVLVDTFLPAGLVLSEGNTRITNVSAGDDLFHTVVTNGGFYGISEADAPDVYAYYEVHFTPGYSGALNIYDGYIGWGSRGSYPLTQPDRDEAPHLITSFWGVGWRGNGTLRTSGGLFQSSMHGSDLQWGDQSVPPIVARVIQNPGTDEFWLGGDGGQFVNRDGTAILGSPVTGGATTTFTRINNNHWIGLMPRNEGDSMRLVSLESEMLFSVPSGCTALSNVPFVAPPT